MVLRADNGAAQSVADVDDVACAASSKSDDLDTFAGQGVAARQYWVPVPLGLPGSARERVTYFRRVFEGHGNMPSSSLSSGSSSSGSP